METRELFERLVTDEPPMTISPSAAVVAGRRQAHRRYAGAASVLVAVVVVGSGVVVEAQRGTTSANGTTASATAAVPSFVFSSAAQIAASNSRVYALLVAYAGGPAAITTGSPLWDTAPISAKTVFVGTQVEYRTPAGTGLLRAVTDTAAEAKTRYGGLLSGDLCAALTGRSTDEGTFLDCAHQQVSGGGSMWTYSRQESSPGQITNRPSTSTLGPAVYERDAVVVAADGSALNLLFQTLTPDPTPIPLTAAIAPSAAELGQIALDVAAGWQPHDGQLTAAPASAAASAAPPSVLGVRSLPFTSTAQVSVAQTKAYTVLVAAGEQEGPLTAKNPPPAITAVPAEVQAQVKLASTTTDIFVHLSVDTAKAAVVAYGSALTKGPCVGAIPNRTAAVKCTSSALAGGGTLWTSEVEHPYLPNGGTVTNGTPVQLTQRDALIVAADGSVLEVNEFAELPHDGNDIALPAVRSLDQAAVASLARSAAAAWQGAAG